jgi:nitroreductase
MEHNKSLLDLIKHRSSIRDFSGENVPMDVLLEIVKAGMAAPSARNLQPWNFIIIQERDILHKLSENLPYAKMLNNAGAAIVVCGTPDIENAELSDYWVQDCSAATENILLAIEACGLGGVWTGVYPRKDRIKWVKDVLMIPDSVVPLNVIPIGFPVKPSVPKNKFTTTKIHWNKW